MKPIKSRYVRGFMRFLFSHIGLSILVFVYCVLGALLFLYFESDLEKQFRNETNEVRCGVEDKRRQLIEKIQVAAAKGELEGVDTIKKWLDEFHNKTLTRNTTIAAYRASTDACDVHPKYKWTMPSAVLFTVTTVAGIGYGNIVPTTDISQFILICYCLIGIPLTLMFLANIGGLFATVARFVFSRGICHMLGKSRLKNSQLLRASNALTQTSNSNSREHTVSSLPEVEETGDRSKFGESFGNAKRDMADTIGLNVGHEEHEHKAQLLVPKTFIFGILAFYTMAGTMLFSWSEDWTYIESGYFNVVTLLTIGLGDYVPGWSEKETMMGKVKMCLGAIYIMLGLGILFMGLNLVIDELMDASKRAGKKIGLVKEDDLKKKKPMSNVERAVRRGIEYW